MGGMGTVEGTFIGASNFKIGEGAGRELNSRSLR